MSAIHWLNPISGSFTNAAYWSGGRVPGSSDDAVLDAVGVSPYTVTTVGASVHSIQTDADATLSITAARFFAGAGTGTGVNAGIILVGAGAIFEPEGNFDNAGAITLGQGAGAAELLIGANTTFSGGGMINLGQTGIVALYNPSKTIQIGIFNIDNTLSGSGTFEIARHTKAGGSLFNESAGVIDANGKYSLSFNMNVYNSGLIEAQGGGLLKIPFPRGVNNTHGTILAGDGSTIEIAGDVGGGVLATSGSGIILVGDGIFSDLTISGNVSVYGAMGLYGSIDNTSDIKLNGNGSYTFVAIERTVTLGGGGSIDMGDSAEYGIVSRVDASTLTNIDNTIAGAGFIGGTKSPFAFTLVNETAGLIDANRTVALTIDTLKDAITNAGTIEATGSGGCIIDSVVVNTGTLSANGGTLMVNAAVTGSGVATINAGVLDFNSSFNEAVTFVGKTGTLELAQSQGFSSKVKGFSARGGTTLDLRDIGFVDAGEATFSGTAAGGVLTVTDGTHTARINLKGDYLNATFIASGDGAGGTDVISRKTHGAERWVHVFISAMAEIGRPASASTRPPQPEMIGCGWLAGPRASGG